MKAVHLGPFELRRPLGRGGMGEVWGGVHRSGVPVAVKVLSVRGARNPDFVNSFRTEVRAAAALDHPNIVMVLDFGIVDAQAEADSGGKLVAGTPFLVMEKADRALSRQDPPPTWLELRSILLALLDGLAHAHARGVIHRDLKVSNVLEGGLRGGIRLTDFGLAHALDRDRPIRSKQPSIGTPAYMAPEQFERRWREYGPWTDLYSLGCVAWVLSTGTSPFGSLDFLDAMFAHLRKAPPAFEPRREVAPGFEDWVATLLEKDPERRFQRAAEASRALRDLGLGARARTHVPATWHQPRTSPAPLQLRDAGMGLYGLRSVPIVGRVPHRDQLWAALRRARRDANTQVVVLRGPSGFGKSRLARWLGEQAHELGVGSVMHAVHSPIPGPRDGLGPMVARYLRVRGLQRMEALHRLEEKLPDPAVVDSLLELVSGALEGMDSDLRVRFGSPHERYEAIRRYLRLSRLPWILWFDDVQWGFDALSFTDFLMGESLPAVVVLTAQDEALATRPSEAALLARLEERGAQALHVGPLEPADCIELVQNLLPMTPALTGQIAERSGGNPLFAVQLVGDWVQRDLLEVRDGGFALKRNVSSELPESLQAVWTTRLERVLANRTEADGIALELAAVLGQNVDAREWAEVCNRASVHPTGDLLERLGAWRLVRVTDAGGWGFVHGMVRESLLHRARVFGRLPGHHGVCAAMLMGRGGQLVAERTGLHLLAAEQDAEALVPLLEGARRRSDRGEFGVLRPLVALRERAMRRLKLPDDDARWGEGWVLLARAARHQGQWDRARTLVDHVEQQSRIHWWPGVLAHALMERARQGWRTCDYAMAAASFDEARSLLEGQDPHGLGLCLLGLAMNHLVQGELEAADGYAKEAAEQFMRQGSVRWLADAYRVRGQVSFQRGALEVARRYYIQGAELFEAEGARLPLAICITGLADVAREDGDRDEARKGYERALALFRALGSPQALHSRLSLAILDIQSHGYDDARTVLLELWTELAADQRVMEMNAVRVFLLVCAAASGDWRIFDDLLGDAVVALESSGLVDSDVGWAAERAGEIARDAREFDRARGAYGLALSQWSALERLHEAQAVMTAMDALPA